MKVLKIHCIFSTYMVILLKRCCRSSDGQPGKSWQKQPPSLSDRGGYFCVLLLSLPKVYPIPKQVKPKLSTAISPKISIWLSPPFPDSLSGFYVNRGSQSHRRGLTATVLPWTAAPEPILIQALSKINIHAQKEKISLSNECQGNFPFMTILMTNEKRKITYDIIQKSTQIPKSPDSRPISPIINNDNIHTEPTRGECWFFVKKVWNRREYGIFKRWDFLESRILYLFWKKYDRRRVSMKFS